MEVGDIFSQSVLDGSWLPTSLRLRSPVKPDWGLARNHGPPGRRARRRGHVQGLMRGNDRSGVLWDSWSSSTVIH